MRSAAPRAALILAAALALFELIAGAHAHLLFGDFRAFACAGAALDHARDPYAAASLYACEHGPMPFGLFSAPAGVTVPAPLPGYALLLFAPLGALPYVLACAIWLLLILGCAVICAWMLAKLAPISSTGAIAVLAVGLGVMVVPYGELSIVVIGALTAMAYALRRERWALAAACAAFAMILPNLGVPALLAVLLFVPAMRGRLIVVAAILAALDLAAGGPALALAYVARVLPAHALSEVARTSQFSLTWAAHALGARSGLAIRLGEIAYVLSAACGIGLARALAKRYGDRAFVALVPPAVAVFGGAFVHYSEIMAALPCALLLAGSSRKPLILGCTLLIALPWIALLNQPVLIVAFSVAAGLVTALWPMPPRAALRAALGAALLAAIVMVAAARFGPQSSAHAQALTIAPGLAQLSWAAYVGANNASSGFAWWFAKMPTWVGLMLLALLCVRRAAQKDLILPVAVEGAPAVS